MLAVSPRLGYRGRRCKAALASIPFMDHPTVFTASFTGLAGTFLKTLMSSVK